jgi:hypothetical protein
MSALLRGGATGVAGARKRRATARRARAGRERVRKTRRPARAGVLGLAGLAFVAWALLLVELRTHAIQLRYRLADALEAQQELLEEQRSLALELQRLRDPQRLAREGSAMGLGRPLRVIALEAHPDQEGSR